jgi:hypothetical protein
MGALGRFDSMARSPVVHAAIGAGLLASFAAAALAHAAIGLAGRLMPGGDAYADRAHVAVGPVALAIAALIVAGLGQVALSTLARRGERDPVRRVADRLARVDPRLAVALVAVGGCTTLLGMEFAEQLVALGHVAGVADAFGGAPLPGLVLVLAAGAVVALAGRRAARWLVAATAFAVTVVVGWLRMLRHAGPTVPSASYRRARRARAVALAFLARCSGLRAPPSIA